MFKLFSFIGLSSLKITARQRRRSSLARLWLGIAVLALAGLGCEYGAVFPPPNTPAPTATQTLTPRPVVPPNPGGLVKIMDGGKSLEIYLDPLSERDTQGVNIQAADLGSAYLVETSDPLGRYLPSIRFIEKENTPSQVMFAPLVDKSWEWEIVSGERLDVGPLLSQYLGTETLEAMHIYLSALAAPSGINVILPETAAFDPLQKFDIYRTPAANTFLLLPAATADGGRFKLAAHQPEKILNRYLILMFLRQPARPLIEYIEEATTISVPDYTGIPVEALVWAEFKAAMRNMKELPELSPIPEGVPPELAMRLMSDEEYTRSIFFLRTIEVSTQCDRHSDKNLIIRQDPLPGSIVNSLDQPVILYICTQVIVPTKTIPQAKVTETPEQSATPGPTSTITPLPSRTRTSTVTSTVTRTGIAPPRTRTVTRTRTSAATSAATSAKTSAPAATKTITRTPVPPTRTTTATPTVTATNTVTFTPTPVFFDDFTTSSSGYSPALWTADGNGTRQWNGGSILRQTVYDGQQISLFSNRLCSSAEIEIHMRSHESTDSDDLVVIGLRDPASEKGVYILNNTGTTTSLTFQAHDGATGSSATFSVDHTELFHTYTILWSTGQVQVYLDGTQKALITSNVPADYLPVGIILNRGAGGADASWIEVDWVKIKTGNCP